MDEIKVVTPTEGTGTVTEEPGIKDKTKRWAHAFSARHPKLIKNSKRVVRVIITAGAAVLGYKAGQRSVKPTEVAVITEPEPQPEVEETPRSEEPTETTTE